MEVAAAEARLAAQRHAAEQQRRMQAEASEQQARAQHELRAAQAAAALERAETEEALASERAAHAEELGRLQEWHAAEVATLRVRALRGGLVWRLGVGLISLRASALARFVPLLLPPFQAECAAALALRERQHEGLLAELAALKSCLPSAAPSRAATRLEGVLPRGLPTGQAASAAVEPRGNSPAATAPGQLMELLSDEEAEPRRRRQQGWRQADEWEQPRGAPPLPAARRGF